MTPEQKRLYAGAALGLVAAALGGFTIARMTAPPAPVTEAADKPDGASDTIAITADGIKTSDIGVEAASAGTAAGIVLASAIVVATPDAQAVLTARAPGTVTRIFKRIGDRVGLGETVALLESRDAAAITGNREAAAARVTLASRQLARERSLLAQGVSPRADYEAAEAQLAVAMAEARAADSAAQAVRLSRDGRSIAVVSPVAGRIIAAPAQLGTFVEGQTELFRVADPRRVQIEASVPLGDAQRIRPGDRVELTTIDGQQVGGRVRSATGVVDPATRQATIVIEPADGALLIAPGQLLQARIHASLSAGSVTGGVMVPQDAVQTIGDRTVVFVRTKTGFRAQPVQVGGRSGGLVSVVSGLAPNTLIAARNAFLLKAELGKESAE